jgi:hypothetical protein
MQKRSVRVATRTVKSSKLTSGQFQELRNPERAKLSTAARAEISGAAPLANTADIDIHEVGCGVHAHTAARKTWNSNEAITRQFLAAAAVHNRVRLIGRGRRLPKFRQRIRRHRGHRWRITPESGVFHALRLRPSPWSPDFLARARSEYDRRKVDEGAQWQFVAIRERCRIFRRRI